MAVGLAIQLAPKFGRQTPVSDSSVVVTADLWKLRLCVIIPSGPPPTPPPDVPSQFLGGKQPVLRPAYDLLADLRPDATGRTLRTMRELQESIERTTRELVEAR